MFQFDESSVDFASLWNPRLYIENVICEPHVKASLGVELAGEGEAFVTERWRCKTTFLENLELLEFPFDVQVRKASNRTLKW